MPYRRRRRTSTRSYGKSKQNKYSNETVASAFLITNESTQGGYQVNTPVVQATNILGTRKVKNFTLNLKVSRTDIGNSNFETQLYYVLAYVPEGVNPSHIIVGDPGDPHTLYEPNQNVILAGLVDNFCPVRIKSRLARNLNSGDQIFLLIYDPRNATQQSPSLVCEVEFTVNYALSF